MRRKSERTASKKSKSSPEKKEKIEKPKHTKARRKKQSSSSASESAEEVKPVEIIESVETKLTDPPILAKDESTKDLQQDQVWQVKTTEVSGDVGEIQKLKLCLARPPSTPERVDRSPRSKRKHSRATSSSDTQSVEGEDKKKSKRRNKRSAESKDVEKIDEYQGDETELQIKETSEPKSVDAVADQSFDKSTSSTDETPMSTTTEEVKCDKAESTESENAEEKTDVKEVTENEAPNDTDVQDKSSDVETLRQDAEIITVSPKLEDNKEQEEKKTLAKEESPIRKRSLSADKSEILELHAEESRCESSEVSFNESQDAKSKITLDQDKDVSNFVPSEVNINQSTNEIPGQPGSHNEGELTDKENEVDIAKNVDKEPTIELDSNQDVAAKDLNTETISVNNKEENSQVTLGIPKTQPPQNFSNGETTPLVINRKRRWGSRPSKLTSQKSITISTEILKEIIPDVKPAEFEEVIEEKKHKRIGIPEKIERPILPKIIIDNTENVEINKKDKKIEDKDHDNFKVKETSLASMRKISIVKERDSIIARPPSPPRHKQSSILYITNLVRPFTLPQLKNLLQRTGRIVDNDFWIDRIKSKCYVKYETEDQAVETRHALHGVTWPVSNPKTLHVDFATQEDFDKAKTNEETDNAQVSTIPGTVEDWLREQDIKREKGDLEKPWERKAAMREWDVGKNEKHKEISRQDKMHRDERPLEKRRHRTPERSPEPARKFKKKEEEAPAKLLDDLFRKTKTTPCIYWLPLSAETIAVKEEQRRQHMAEHERRLQELRRTHRRH